MSRFRPSILLLALTFAALSACDKVNLLAPTGSTVTLSVNRTSVPIGGTAEAVAVVVEAAGTAPQDGTTVTFSSTFGTMTPQEAQTQGGIARAMFTATGSGTAKIGAFSGAAKATEVEVKAGTAAASAVSVHTEPATIPQSGGTVTVVASVIDASGGPLANTLINFSVDNGNLSASATTTDARGEARVTLTTNRTTKVNAAAGTIKATEFTLTAIANPTINITCPTTPVSVGVAFSCTVTPATTPTVALTNVTINWGDGTGEKPLGAITNATVASNTYTRADTFTVTVTAIDQNGQRGIAQVQIIAVRVLPTITITASATTGVVGTPVSFIVTPQANPPQPITSVVIDFGDGSSRSLSTTGASTVARSYSAEGGYTVTATITDQSGNKGSASTFVAITKGTGPTVTFTQTNTTVNPRGEGTFSVGATAGSGLSIRSITVTKFNGGQVVYSQQGGSTNTFFLDNLVVGDVLTAVATDSAGNQGQVALQVK